jgi:hypothetical protein
MELFYSNNIVGDICVLAEEEGRHCVKVLRHGVGDEINVIDGEGIYIIVQYLIVGKRLSVR